MIMVTTQEIPDWEWGTGCLESGRPAELTSMARTCNDAALLAAEALTVHDRSFEMQERATDDPSIALADAWSTVGVRYFDTMVAAYTNVAAQFAAEMAITTSVLLAGGHSTHVAAPTPSAILIDSKHWLPLMTIPAVPPTRWRPPDEWANERAKTHADEHAEVRRALECFMFDGRVTVLDDPTALVDGADVSMIPAWDLAIALHRYAAGLHWTCASLSKTNRDE
jgi:hypothetical protein